MKTSTWLMMAAVFALAVAPLLIHVPVEGDEAFAGSDGQAVAQIEAMRPDYEPWFSPLFEPPSSEIESLLFTLQAALGAGVIGFYFGRARGRLQAAKAL